MSDRWERCRELTIMLSAIGLLFLMIHSDSAAVNSSETAFQTFKSLQGKWAIQSGGKTQPIEMTYEVAPKALS